MLQVEDGLEILDMDRASTAPLPKTPEKKQPDVHLLSPLAIPDMTRVTTVPVRGRKTARVRISQPRSFELPVSHNSEESINVEVPSRVIINKMTFYDAPLSSIYGPQLTSTKLTAMWSKIIGMGFSNEQALVGLILSDASSIGDAINIIFDLPTCPAEHGFVERKSNSGDNVQGKHKLLSIRPESGSNRWPWDVEEDLLCRDCGLPRQLFHKGDYDLNAMLGRLSNQSEQHVDYKEEKHNDSVPTPAAGTSYIFMKETQTINIVAEPKTIEDCVTETKEANKEEFITCGICFEELSREKIFLAPCKHYYCKLCLTHHYRTKINDGDVLRLPCLYLDEYNIPCEREVEEEEILSFCDDEMKAKFNKFKQARLIQLNDKARSCPRAGCQGYVIGSRVRPKLTCGECGYVFCWKCTNDWHGYFSRCVQRHEAAFLAFTLGKDIQKCPKCKVRIWKSDGCNHMTCNYCRYEFCWLCRGKYRSNHFSSWNLMGCPGGQYFDAGRCPGFCPSYVNRCLLWICFFGVLLPLAITFASILFSLFLTAIGIWLSIWAIICFPASINNRNYITPCGCKDECCD